MGRSHWIAWGLALAAPAGAQQAPTPAVPVDKTEDSATTSTANRATLSSTAAQTSRIMQDKDAYAADLAAFRQAQARYAADVKAFEEAKRATAQQAAADDAAYQQRLAAWRNQDEAAAAARKPRPPAPARRAGPARVVCATETPTGSNIPVRHCRTVEQLAADGDSARRNLDANAQNIGTRLVNPQ